MCHRAAPSRPCTQRAGFAQNRLCTEPLRRRPAPPPAQISGRPLGYTVCDWSPPVGDRLTEALYEPYVLQSIAIEAAKSHPTPLVQSASMASVCPPKPGYVPLLPDGLVASRVVMQELSRI